MISRYVSFIVLFLCIITSIPSVTFLAKGCKDIVACGDATAGNYNLLLKVRDPSRPGLQVLCIIPEGYTYTYHHPWTGEEITYTVHQKCIGVATKGDTIPDIVKAGMVLTDAGLAFGDADTNSGWINPTRYAWDDFDWIRYACQEAHNEEEAVSLLTSGAVDMLHAPGVSENLFVVGPHTGFVVEADAAHYSINEVNGIAVMSNYPKDLWRTQYHKLLPIASTFYTEKDTYVPSGSTIRLDSLYGVQILEMGADRISCRQVPFIKFQKTISYMGSPIMIERGQRKTVGDFSVELIDIVNNQAHVRVTQMWKAWEDTMMQYIEPCYGSLTVKDMMQLSRLHEDDLDGLRPMCEDRYPYEAAAIYKIPEKDYETMSSGWFAANHACSSIYVPFHICDTDIYSPFGNGDAAQVSQELLRRYGHAVLSTPFSTAEDVFLYETEKGEQVATKNINDSSTRSALCTHIDMGMQKQAWLTMGLWMKASSIPDEKNKQDIIQILTGIWEKNYTISLKNMQHALWSLQLIPGTNQISNDIRDIIISIQENQQEMLFYHR